jgi:stage V sporulation protein B
LHRKKPIFYSALLLTGVNLLLRLVSTSFQVYISGRIGAEGVGLLQLVLSLGGLSLTLGMAGIRTTAMYLTAEELGRKREQNVHWVLRGCFLYSLAFSGAAGVLLWFAAPTIAQSWIGNPNAAGAVRLFGVFLPIVCLCGCLTGYFTAANKIGTLALVEIFEQLCYMAVTMAVLHLWAGSDPGKACRAVVLGSGISSSFTLVCLLLLRRKHRCSDGPPIPIAHRLLTTALPLALADNVKAGISTTENLMVPKRLALYPGEISPLAAFGTVCGMVFPVLMFPAAILFALAELLIPEMARCNATGSSRRIQYLASKSLKLAMLYGCLCGGVLFVLAKPLCLGLYQSSTAGSYLRLYSLLAPMLYCDAITDAMTKGLGQQRICVRYNIITSAMDVALLFLLLPRYGMLGYFVSFLVTHLINFILSLRLLLKITGIHIPLHLPVFTVSAALAGIWGASFASGTAFTVTAFLGIFGSLLFLFGVLSKKDLRWLKGLIKRA